MLLRICDAAMPAVAISTIRHSSCGRTPAVSITVPRAVCGKTGVPVHVIFSIGVVMAMALPFYLFLSLPSSPYPFSAGGRLCLLMQILP